jgi:hypothetical protein
MMMKIRFGRNAFVAVAAILTAGAVAAAPGGPPAGEEGQRTLIFRSLEDPTVSNQPQNCPCKPVVGSNPLVTSNTS